MRANCRRGEWRTDWLSSAMSVRGGAASIQESISIGEVALKPKRVKLLMISSRCDMTSMITPRLKKPLKLCSPVSGESGLLCAFTWRGLKPGKALNPPLLCLPLTWPIAWAVWGAEDETEAEVGVAVLSLWGASPASLRARLCRDWDFISTLEADLTLCSMEKGSARVFCTLSSSMSTRSPVLRIMCVWPQSAVSPSFFSP
mmetsp:Transcript_9841/g.21901  ORF Transcript_9841/g.21901 Transcript_9841/m.21901 type:complete len:201 (+) Transcript_9841:2162-2764(+)